MITIGLSGCTSAQEPDWSAAQSQADAFTDASSTSENSLGWGSWRAVPNTRSLIDEGSVTLEYTSEARVDSINAACFGGGEARFTATVRMASAGTTVDSMTLSCDGEPRLVPLGASLEHVNAIPFSGGIDEGDGAVIAAVVAGVAD